MEHIYSLRKNFTIIGLTGTMGSGCSKVAELLSKDDKTFLKNKLLRSPDSIEIIENGKVKYENVLFKKKYKICYDFMKANWKQYIFIDYKKVILLYCLDYFINIKKSKNFETDFSNFIISNFTKAKMSDKNDFNDSDKRITKKELKTIFNKHIKILIKDIKSIRDEVPLIDIKSPEKLERLHNIFFTSNSEFNLFFISILNLFTKKNYYLRTYFFHRIACTIRQSGQPDKVSADNNVNYVYNLAKLTNRLIKAYKSMESNKSNCHIVINSIKNSLEIMYFKERYSAFYMMAIHGVKNREDVFESMVQSEHDKEVTVKKLIELDDVEYRIKDFKAGLFSSPDIENCIQKSEIHIINNGMISKKGKRPNDFFTLYEQLIKFLALIQQPGLITPSNIERCMQIAFNSKSNSGCISRQVGAVVTDENYSIKSVGWNDTPKQTIPCLLRNIEEVLDNNLLDPIDNTYSDFELSKSKFKYKLNESRFNIKGENTNSKYNGNNFAKNISQEYSLSKIKPIKIEGKNCSFCFKTLHNKFEGEDNQVHTRSLHAEENAMLQISKFGGQGLKNGYLFTTASPCELCSKKAYQLGIKKIIYIDKYPGISKEHIIGVGFDAPVLVQFNGVIGRSFNKLYEPFIAYKDELSLYLKPQN